MINISVKVDLQGLQRDINKLRRNAVPKAAARSINKALDQTATAAAREIAKATGFPVRQVRARLVVRRAYAGRLVGELEALGFSPNLAKYGKPRQTPQGVVASAWGQRKVYRGAFINPKSGRVVTRKTDKRTPLKGLRGPSVRSTFMKQAVLVKLESVARQSWRTNFDRELARELARK